MPGCHTQTHTMTCTHTRLLSGKQSQRHSVTETKPQKRRLALCDNPLTHIYIQGLEYASVPPSPPPAILPPPPHPPFPPPFSVSSFLNLSHLAKKLSPWSDWCVYYQWMVHGLAWQLP